LTKVQKQSDIPVLKIDELMVRDALSRATWIGLVATVPAGLSMQRQLIDQIAAEMGREVKLDAVLKPEAFQALSSGNRDEHDRIVLAEVERLAERNELVMLAQASMGHLASKVPASVKVPVLLEPDPGGAEGEGDACPMNPGRIAYMSTTPEVNGPMVLGLGTPPTSTPFTGCQSAWLRRAGASDSQSGRVRTTWPSSVRSRTPGLEIVAISTVADRH